MLIVRAVDLGSSAHTYMHDRLNAFRCFTSKRDSLLTGIVTTEYQGAARAGF